MRNTFLLTLIVSTVTIVEAQKLPNIQKESVRAPANIKIDGKATEWDNRFKAQNSATELFYTVSNDDANLYLTVQTKYMDVINKIMLGGITFNVNPTVNKKADTQTSVTYPELDLAGTSMVTNLLTHADKRDVEKNPGAELLKGDELTKIFSTKAKVVSVSGIREVATPEISIYNDNGIQVAARFDNDMAYTYELAIPLKYLSLPENGSKPFSYQVKVNEPRTLTPKFDGNGPPPPPPPPMLKTAVATTDFWGEYTLAKK